MFRESQPRNSRALPLLPGEACLSQDHRQKTQTDGSPVRIRYREHPLAPHHELVLASRVGALESEMSQGGNELAAVATRASTGLLDLDLGAAERGYSKSPGYPHEDPLLDDFCELVTTGLQRRPRRDHARKSRDGGAEHAAVHLPVPSTPQRLVEVGRDHRSLARPENTPLSPALTGLTDER